MKQYNRYISITKKDGGYYICVKIYRTGRQISTGHTANTKERALVKANQIAQEEEYYDLPIIEE